MTPYPLVIADTPAWPQRLPDACPECGAPLKYSRWTGNTRAPSYGWHRARCDRHGVVGRVACPATTNTQQTTLRH